MEPDAEVLSFRVWCLALGYRAAEAEATGLGKLVFRVGRKYSGPGVGSRDLAYARTVTSVLSQRPRRLGLPI